MGKALKGFSLNATGLVLVLMTAMPMGARAADARISDSTVKVLVETELAKRGLPGNIGIHVEDRIVRLSGSVSTLAEREKIEKIARKTQSVSRVENNLGVTMTGSDAEIAEAVRKSIATNSGTQLPAAIKGSIHSMQATAGFASMNFVLLRIASILPLRSRINSLPFCPT